MVLAKVHSTYGSREDALGAGRDLVERRLAACIHVHEHTAVYRWKSVQEEQEWKLEVTCREADVDAVWDALLTSHPYDVPCVEVAAPVQVPAPYLRWAKQVTKRRDD